MPIGQHIMLRLMTREPFATTPEARRVLARVIFEKDKAAGSDVLSFGLPDAHLHICAACSRKKAGDLSRRVTCALARRLGLKVRFAPPNFKDINDSWHLRNTFRYALTQDQHHGVDCDPLREGTNLPDLLKARICGQHTLEALHRFLPRVTLDNLLELFGLKELKPLDGPVEQVVLATLLAAGLPDLKGSGPEVRQARRAAIEVVGARLRPHALAELVGLSRRRLDEVRAQPPHGELVLAIRRQLFLISLLPPAALSPVRDLQPASVLARPRLRAPSREAGEVAPPSRPDRSDRAASSTESQQAAPLEPPAAPLESPTPPLEPPSRPDRSDRAASSTESRQAASLEPPAAPLESPTPPLESPAPPLPPAQRSPAAPGHRLLVEDGNGVVGVTTFRDPRD